MLDVVWAMRDVMYRRKTKAAPFHQCPTFLTNHKLQTETFLEQKSQNNNMLMTDRFIHEADLPAPNETSLEDIFLPVDYKPSREDVICSRGSISYHHSE